MHTSQLLLASLAASIGACTGATAGAPSPATASGRPAATANPALTTREANPIGEYNYTLSRTGDVHDFDFIEGAWTLHNRRLKARGVGSHEWDEFPAVDCGSVQLGGVVNIDELKFPTKGWAGVTLRTFDLEKRQWSIYWISSRTGKLLPPVVGGFQGDRGEFYGEDEDEGKPVKVRFLWIKHGPDHAHWEQAFSLDDGRTWEVNWMMDLTRADPAQICDRGQPRT